MKKEMEIGVGLVGLDIKALTGFVKAHQAELENKKLSVPGDLGEKGVKVIKTSLIDVASGDTPVASLELDGVDYTVLY